MFNGGALILKCLAASRCPADDLAVRRQGSFLLAATQPANFTAFQAAGGKGEFHDYVPPEGLSGHRVADAPGLWTEALEAYLADQGLPARLVPAGAQAIDGNTIKMGGTTYRLWGIDAPELDLRCYADDGRAGIEAARTLSAMIERGAITCEARTRVTFRHAVALCRAGGRILARPWSRPAWHWPPRATAPWDSREQRKDDN